MADIYYEIAANLFNKRKYSEALKILEEFTASEDVNWLTLKARCYEKLERHEDEFKAALAAFNLGTNSLGIVNAIGEGYLRKHEYESAAEMFSMACDCVSRTKDKEYFTQRKEEAIKLQEEQGKENSKKASTEASTSKVPEASTTVLPTASTEGTEVEASTEVIEVEASIDASPIASSEVNIKNSNEEFGEIAKEESIEVAKKEAETLPLFEVSSWNWFDSYTKKIMVEND